MGSALFLCVQILMLLDFVVNWNDTWVDQEDNRCAARIFLFLLEGQSLTNCANVCQLFDVCKCPCC